MELLYLDEDIIVCIKPPRVLSTDESGGLPDLIREELGDPKADVRTVHRLDRVVSGVMVVARSHQAASNLSQQIRDDRFNKKYLAVVHGTPVPGKGIMKDLLGRDKARKMTYVAEESGKGIQEAILEYDVLSEKMSMSLVRIHLITGRTHQIRVQFSSRNMPLVGERKYATREDSCEIALWSESIGFYHPRTGNWMEFSRQPPDDYPWRCF